MLVPIVLAIFWAGNAFGQSFYDDLRFKRYDAGNGLPSGACDIIYRDSYGFLWVSNYYGVSIFDGTHFFNLPMYSHDDAFNLSRKPHYFLQLSDDRMLITAPTGLYIYSYATHTVERLENQPVPVSRDLIEILGKSANGQSLYLRTSTKIYILDVYLNLKKEIPFAEPQNKIKNIGTESAFTFFDQQGRLAILNMENDQVDIIQNILPTSGKAIVNGEHADEYLVCYNQKIFRIDKKSKNILSSYSLPKELKPNSHFELSSIALDKYGNYWIAGYEKLFVYFPSKNSVSDLSNILLDACRKGEAHVVDIKVSDEEIYLSVAAASGILISDRTISLIKNYEGFSEKRDAVFSLTNHNGKLICSGFDNEITVLSGDLANPISKYYHIKDLFSIAHLENLDKNHLWVVTWEKFKLGILNTTSYEVSFPELPVDSLSYVHLQSFNIVLPTKDAIPIVKKKSEDCFYYSVNNRLYVIKGDIANGFEFTLIDSIPSPSYITSIDVANSGNVYIGTSTLQVFQLKDEKLQKIIESKNPNIPVRYVLEDSKKNRYVLSTNGVYVYDDGNNYVTHLSMATTQLPGNIVYSGFINNKDVLWMSTNAGLVAYDCGTRNIFKLSTLKSISNVEFNTKCYALDGNRAYFGGSKGITFVDTDLFSDKPRNFHLFFHWIKWQDSIYHSRILPGSISEEKEIPYNNNNLSLSVHAISTLQAEPFEIRYMMEGIDTIWRAPSSAPIEFMGLSPGKYVLRVKGKYPNSETVEEITYRFIIASPFWQKWWFISGILIAAVLFFFFLINYWYRKKNERERMETSRQTALKGERERISQELHDDLGSGLTAIRLLSKSVAANPEGPKSPKMLSNISKISEELIDQMSEIIWVLNHSDDTFNSLIVHLRLYMASYLQRIDNPIKLTLNSSVTDDLNISNTQRRNILLVIKEAFHNTVKHSGGDQFSVLCNVTDDILEIVIQDNGKGFTDSTDRGNGLNNIHKRIATINGTAKFEKETGIKITINIQLEK